MSRAIIVVDVQNDFCEGGSLPVEGGAQVAKDILHYMATHQAGFTRMVATKDCHNQIGTNSGHFAEQPDYYDTWPAHCVNGTWGYNFKAPLRYDRFDEIFKKGRGIPAYSGFQGVGARSGLTLHEYLVSDDITKLTICGIASTHCVKATVFDALDRGFEVEVPSELTVAVGGPEAQQKALAEMYARGATIS